jgi:hypothetical protein
LICGQQNIGAPPKITQDRTWTKDTESQKHPVHTYCGITLHWRKFHIKGGMQVKGI